jgi:ribose transport system ATP-binding protein
MASPPTTALRMEGITKRFGATAALRGVSLQVAAGEVLALIGENGAGKSTLMKVLSGVYRPDAGSMEFLGRTYTPRRPHDALSAGVAMIYQELNLAPDLSVEDNIMLGQESTQFGMLNRAEQRRRVRAALALLGHADLPLARSVRRLSVGMQQLVEIARALVLSAKVIVFDEPTSSLTQHDAENLFRVIDKLKSNGIAVVYISHFLEELRRVADRFVVLRDGQSVGQGRLVDVTESEIISMMVGRSVDELFPAVPHQAGEVLLELEGLTGCPIVPRNVDLQLRRGEILGLFGLVGAGRTELLRALMALDPIRSGRVRLAGSEPPAITRARIRAGLALVSEDRKTEGLAQIRSIADNATLSRLGPYSRWGWINLRKRRAAVDEWMSRLQVKARSQDQAVAQLSGGNQQKVAIARALHQNAEVILLDEPTRGIDVGTKAEIYRLIGQLAAEGKGVIFVSSYLPELLNVCDRVGVMVRGRLREVRPASAWTEEAVMTLAIRPEGDA